MFRSLFSFKLFCVIGIAVALSACANENPNLVNPPSNVDYIKVRFINLAGDFQLRGIKLDGNVIAQSVAFNTSSGAVNPPADSGYLSVYKDGRKEFTPARMTHFQRDITYSYFALPSFIGNPNNRSVDTLITMTTSLGMPANTQDCYIKLFNAFPDSLSSFAMTIGCPSATQIFSNVFYRQITQPMLINTGNVPISISRRTPHGETILGTYSINLISKGQYAVIVTQDENNNPKIMLLDEFKSESDALSPANPVIERYSRIRLINISQSKVSAIKDPGDVIANDLQPLSIGDYAQVGACKSAALDSVYFFQNGSYSTSLKYSFDVLKDYSIILLDSASKLANNAIVIPPPTSVNFSGKSLITVINATTSLNSFDLSIASRGDASPIGFSSGSYLAKSLTFSQVSQPMVIDAGILPFSIFTAGTPYSLIYNGFANVQADKSYLLIVFNDSQNNLKTTLIDNTQENAPVQFLDNCSFLQVLQAISGTESIKLSIPGQIPSGTLYYSSSLASVLPIAPTQINASVNSANLNISINPDPAKHYTIIFSGSKESPDYILIEDDIRTPEVTNYKYRFVNASNDLSSVGVALDTSFQPSLAVLNYKTVSPFATDVQQKLKTFYFYNAETSKLLTKISLNFTLSKSYTIIFAGSSKNKDGYSSMIIQDY